MASAQVLPNPGAASSRKKGHLEAGRRRLEEFRKNKGRKAPAVQLSSNDSESHNKFSNDGGHEQPISDESISNAVEPSTVNVHGRNPAPVSTKDEGHEIYGPSGPFEMNDPSGIYQGTTVTVPNVNKIDQVPLKIQSDLDVQDTRDTVNEVMNPESNSQSNANLSDLGNSDNHSRHFDRADASGSRDFSKEQATLATTSSPGFIFANAIDDQGSYASNIQGKISDSINRRLNAERPHSVLPEYSSADFAFGLAGSTQHSFPSRMQGNVTGRSRPSFLDSINISYSSSAPDTSSNYAEVDPPLLSKIPYGGEVQLMSSQQSLVKIGTEEPYDNHQNIATHDLKAPSNKDDDFAALEQHIEDLTREKFSLQRALETSQSLAGSLASENSSLTESYNQQGTLVNQLKYDMERLQDEIKAQLLAYESLKLECANIRLECTASDERAKILASEVINLEEKALRLRSNELKLEKQLENSNDEITSYKRKLSSIEKERNDLESTIEALQEEKKLLQRKVRKASSPEKSNDRGSIPNKKDVCTSTDDLGDGDGVNDAESTRRNPVEAQGLTSMLHCDASTSSFEDISGSYLGSGTIPPDHIRMINNINSLLSELMVEKEGLMQTLAAESSLNSKLKDLNKELSLKLEAQTQRFELLAAQKNVLDNVPLRQVSSERIGEVTEYTDEGDEVVERVLGWIMKLFPGGPGKRHTSRLL